MKSKPLFSVLKDDDERPADTMHTAAAAAAAAAGAAVTSTKPQILSVPLGFDDTSSQRGSCNYLIFM